MFKNKIPYKVVENILAVVIRVVIFCSKCCISILDFSASILEMYLALLLIGYNEFQEYPKYINAWLDSSEIQMWMIITQALLLYQ